MLQPSVSLYLCTCFEALLVVLVLLDLVNVAALLLLLVGQQLPLVVRAVDLQQAVDAAPEVKMDFSKKQSRNYSRPVWHKYNPNCGGQGRGESAGFKTNRVQNQVLVDGRMNCKL